MRSDGRRLQSIKSDPNELRLIGSTNLPSDGKVVRRRRGDAVARRSMATTKVRQEGPINPSERLLDVREAASRLGVKVSTLRAWTYQRRIPVVKLLGRTVRFRERDLQRLIEESTRPPLGSAN